METLEGKCVVSEFSSNVTCFDIQKNTKTNLSCLFPIVMVTSCNSFLNDQLLLADNTPNLLKNLAKMCTDTLKVDLFGACEKRNNDSKKRFFKQANP